VRRRLLVSERHATSRRSGLLFARTILKCALTRVKTDALAAAAEQRQWRIARTISICSWRRQMPLEVNRCGAAVAAAQSPRRASFAAPSGAVPRRGVAGDRSWWDAPGSAAVLRDRRRYRGRRLRYVNIRETAGWAADAAMQAPRCGADAAATEPVPDISYVTLNSDGVVSFTDVTSRRSRPRTAEGPSDVTG